MQTMAGRKPIIASSLQQMRSIKTYLMDTNRHSYYNSLINVSPPLLLHPNTGRPCQRMRVQPQAKLSLPSSFSEDFQASEYLWGEGPWVGFRVCWDTQVDRKWQEVQEGRIWGGQHSVTLRMGEMWPIGYQVLQCLLLHTWMGCGQMPLPSWTKWEF